MIKNGKRMQNGMKKIIFTAIVAAVYLMQYNLHAENSSARRNVSVCVYDNSPKIIITKDNKIQGFHPEIIDAIGNMAGWNINYVVDSWDGCLKRLEENSVDIVPDMAKSPEREGKFYFNNESILINWACIYTKRGIKIESLFDLKNMRVAVMKKSIHTNGPGGIVDLLKKFEINCEIIMLDDYSEVFELLHNNKCDVGVVNRLYGNRFEKQFDVVRTSIIFNPIHLLYGFSMLNENKLYYSQTLDENLRKLKKNPDSVYYKSLERLLNRDVIPERFVIPKWIMYLIVAGASVIFFIFLLAILLKVQVNKKTETIMALNRDLENRIHERTLELENARVRAETADRVKSSFLATMSHELRTPLNSIIGFTSILLQGLAGALNEEQKKQLGMVRGSAQHLLSLINDILDISKIEAGQFEVHAELFDVRAVIEKAAAALKPAAEKKMIKLEVNIGTEVGMIVSDQRRVEQVLLNLLSNAIKFTEQGCVTLSVKTIFGYKSTDEKLESDSIEAIEFKIADTGIGIHHDDLQELFQPFRQIDTGLARKNEGTGLGLAICRRLADLMDGEINAESELGKGSVFTFIIPLGKKGVH